MLKILYFIIPLLRNSNLPICINCIHFLQHKTYYPDDQLPDDYSYGRCNKFGKINIITGDIDYDFAINSRQDSQKCGLKGLYYEDKNNSSKI
jgi:hypothetical protein